VTSLPPEKAGPEQLLQLIRAYWEIETGVHQRLDVGLHEDQCRIRNTQVGWALGWMRRTVIAEFYQWKSKVKQSRDATSPKFLAHNAGQKTKLINLFTSPV
jgi:hypothetical protein